MARLTRHKLKQDEFATKLAAFQEFFLQYEKQLIIGAVAVVLAAGVVLGGYYYLRSRQAKANSALAQALSTFHATAGNEPPPITAATVPHFKTTDEKYQQAYKQFSEIAGDYSRYRQGRIARYYAALSERGMGKLPEAEKDLSALSAGRDQDLASLAKMALAGVYQQTGRNDQAEKLYRELEEHPTNMVPKATVELALAGLYQKTKPAEAEMLYKKIETEYPGSAAGDMASQQLESQPQKPK